jgi:hypothetical protein
LSEEFNPDEDDIKSDRWVIPKVLRVLDQAFEKPRLYGFDSVTEDYDWIDESVNVANNCSQICECQNKDNPEKCDAEVLSGNGGAQQSTQNS